jgi:threonine dehydrogenase-like Zn-dependent dehydrogenase
MRAGGVIGHEYVGRIVDAGDGVAGFAAGDRVLGSFLIACGRCRFCDRNQFNFCRNRRALGLGPLTGDLDGAQAELVRIPDADVNCHRLDDSLSDEQALFGGDILATGFHAALLSEIERGQVAVVIGAGPVGLCTAMACAARGGRVLVLDADASRVSFAQQLGFEAIDVSDTDAAAEVNSMTDGDLADVAIDAVGAVPVVKTAMKCVHDGGRVTVVGVYGTERWELPMGMAWIRGIDVRFSGMANVQAQWDLVLDAIAGGAIDPTKLITHRLALDDAEKGYELFASREAMKVVMTP